MSEIWKNSPQIAQRFFQRKTIVKRTKIIRAIIGRIPRKTDRRPIAFHINPNVHLRFVVAQQNVVSRHITLDHLTFQKQRINLTLSFNPISIKNFRHQCHSFVISPARILKILTYAIFKNRRLADINYLAARRLMKINTGRSRQSFQLGLQCLIH